MVELKPDECRVLGVLIEKAQTVPGQYPITLNGLTAGCNQKNNRNPVVEWDEERVLDALDGLRNKKLASEVILTGSRVAKFKHNSREVLGVDTSQLVVLAELMLRGPQSLGELRQNASRMHPIESLESARGIVDSLMSPAPPQRESAMVKELPPPPGGRARVYVQLLCPDLHPVGAVSPHATERAAVEPAGGGLEARVAALEADVERLKQLIAALGPG
ncbi:MAG TPA: DUF480 domain-containing protein [Phycisphaerales bacterium]|jgi:uncharacterized protein YceH (UPF0502 family)|nr:DUF480 domain-containing protein [Phycisphaerales bacterium]